MTPVAQEVQLGDGKNALAQVEHQVIGGQDGEELLVGLVVLLGAAVHSVVI